MGCGATAGRHAPRLLPGRGGVRPTGGVPRGGVPRGGVPRGGVLGPRRRLCLRLRLRLRLRGGRLPGTGLGTGTRAGRGGARKTRGTGSSATRRRGTGHTGPGRPAIIARVRGPGARRARRGLVLFLALTAEQTATLLLRLPLGRLVRGRGSTGPRGGRLLRGRLLCGCLLCGCLLPGPRLPGARLLGRDPGGLGRRRLRCRRLLRGRRLLCRRRARLRRRRGSLPRLRGGRLRCGRRRRRPTRRPRLRASRARTGLVARRPGPVRRRRRTALGSLRLARMTPRRTATEDRVIGDARDLTGELGDTHPTLVSPAAPTPGGRDLLLLRAHALEQLRHGDLLTVRILGHRQLPFPSPPTSRSRR